ncbi:hypothetical protein [Herbiconiux sp. YIM B11900]|uniref:hypothetical protein n=1 Tax=Herbiconiux sp. YIM B11900 TaxID=3404131 RepID=UPI003F83EC8E
MTRYVTSRQAETYFTATNPTDLPIDVVFQAPRFQGAVELYGYGFGAWDISLNATTLTCTATVPAQSSLTTPFLGYFTRTPPTSAVLQGVLSPAANPPAPFVSITFS